MPLKRKDAKVKRKQDEAQRESEALNNLLLWGCVGVWGGVGDEGS